MQKRYFFILSSLGLFLMGECATALPAEEEGDAERGEVRLSRAESAPNRGKPSTKKVSQPPRRSSERARRNANKNHKAQRSSRASHVTNSEVSGNLDALSNALQRFTIADGQAHEPSEERSHMTIWRTAIKLTDDSIVMLAKDGVGTKTLQHLEIMDISYNAITDAVFERKIEQMDGKNVVATPSVGVSAVVSQAVSSATVNPATVDPATVDLETVNPATVATYLKGLLAKDAFKFLDITGNNFSSKGLQLFFNKLPNKELGKVVWIPEEEIDNFAWAETVCNKNRLKNFEKAEDGYLKHRDRASLELAAFIETSHRNYYSTLQSHEKMIRGMKEGNFIDWKKIARFLELSNKMSLAILGLRIEQGSRSSKEKLGRLLFEGKGPPGIKELATARRVFLQILRDEAEEERMGRAPAAEVSPTTEHHPGDPEYYLARIGEINGDLPLWQIMSLYQSAAAKGHSLAIQVLDFDENGK